MFKLWKLKKKNIIFDIGRKTHEFYILPSIVYYNAKKGVINIRVNIFILQIDLTFYQKESINKIII